MYVLIADSAVYAARGCRREVARSTSRAELEARKRELDAADVKRGRYSTVRWIEPCG